MIFSCYSLGCKVNQIEVEKIISDLVEDGYTYTQDYSLSDFIIINTCTVTEKSDNKSLRTINKFARLENIKHLFITGCYTELEVNLSKKISPKNIIVSQKEKMTIPKIVDNTLSGMYGYSNKDKVGDDASLRDRWQAFKNSRVYVGSLSNQQSLFFDHKRAFIKIQDGCNYFCSYCRIPFARGAPVTRSYSDLMSQVEKIIAEYKNIPEIVLSGINIGTYYDKASGKRFGELVRDILNSSDRIKLRISSIEPHSLDEVFFSVLGHKNLVPHIHLALQGTSDRILKNMNRRYDLAEFKSITDRFYKANPNFSITSDIIVGFGDETDEEFDRGLEVVRDLGFSKIHVFPFSVRSLTNMDESSQPSSVTPAIKKERSARMRFLSEERHRDFLNKMVGVEQYFIVESEVGSEAGKSKTYKGTSEYYMKGQVTLPNDRQLSRRINERIAVRLVRSNPVEFEVVD